MKRTITNMAAAGIIYRRSRPNEIFLDRKDNGHPIKLVRGQLCFVGGFWIGDSAKNDRNPLETFRREIGEEWTLERPMRNSHELALMGMADETTFEPTPINNIEIAEKDKDTLNHIKQLVASDPYPVGDFINTIPRAAFQSADPDNKRDDLTVLISYYSVGLDEHAWHNLRELQDKFGNLSAESVSVITSLEEIVEKKIHTAFGHDRVLRAFFLSHGLDEAWQLPLVHYGTDSFCVGEPRISYADYLKEFDVLNKPI